MKKVIAILLVALLGLLQNGCGGVKKPAGEQPAANTAPTKVTVVLDWVPNTNHTGLYVAKEQGYYAEEGLDVEIIQPTAGGTAQLIAAGQGDFGVSYQEEVTLARSSDVPVKSVAAVIQHNTSGFASHQNRNIKTPRDFEGKKYGGWGSPVEMAMIKALMDKHGGDVKKVEEVNIGTADFFSSIEKDVDFAWIYYGWTGIEAELRQVPLDIIMLKDEEPALDFYTPVLIASEKTLQDKPELVKRFLKATARGYRFAIENPDASADILLKHAPELNPELVKASQRWLSPRYQDDAPEWGMQKPEVWQAYAKWMFERGLLPREIDAVAAFSNEFLP